MIIPDHIIQMRRMMCRIAKCTVAHDFSDPCASCAVGGWDRGPVDCSSAPTTTPAAPPPVDILHQACTAVFSDAPLADTALEALRLQYHEQIKALGGENCTGCQANGLKNKFAALVEAALQSAT